MKRSRLVLAVLILLSATLAAGAFAVRPWHREEQAEALRLITGPPAIDYLPQYIALAGGYFQTEKLALKITTAASKDALLAALANGHADVALTGLEDAVYSRAVDGQKATAFAALTDAGNTFLLARKPPESFKWTDLKGKTVITGRPDSRETVLLEGVLRRHGIKPNLDVTLYTNIPDGLRAGAFESGSGDYILADGALASRLEFRRLGTVAASLDKETGTLPALVYVTRTELINNSPRALQRFTNAIYRAQLWLARHDATEAAGLAAPYLKGMNREEIIKLINLYRAQQTWPADPVIRRDGYNDFVQLLDQAREIPRPVDYSQMVNSSFAGAAVTNIPDVPEEKKERWFDPLLKIFSW
ncbi:ABC transporter substrate-binding protein [Desulfotomaculum copahuensis]|uniref:Cyclic nucleotide-binding domain-containing protein n=1 Tax=Desulfotomaculum copahuensis TaxID=1838280 RepID=A0A1B7LF02_9FIRM|nr:ABC transporter substrate-binding protein [Desulfotomaculum copahuensis]OAT82219.1 hypothetical protein A6M21_08600 [Desulfotomaculum copahuensis]